MSSREEKSSWPVRRIALAAHGVPRATGDLDIRVRRTPEHAGRGLAALRAFGAPLFNLTTDDLSCPEEIIQVGAVPVRIELLTSSSGVGFEEAWSGRISASIAL